MCCAQHVCDYTPWICIWTCMHASQSYSLASLPRNPEYVCMYECMHVHTCLRRQSYIWAQTIWFVVGSNPLHAVNVVDWCMHTCVWLQTTVAATGCGATCFANSQYTCSASTISVPWFMRTYFTHQQNAREDMYGECAHVNVNPNLNSSTRAVVCIHTLYKNRDHWPVLLTTTTHSVTTPNHFCVSGSKQGAGLSGLPQMPKTEPMWNGVVDDTDTSWFDG